MYAHPTFQTKRPPVRPPKGIPLVGTNPPRLVVMKTTTMTGRCNLITTIDHRDEDECMAGGRRLESSLKFILRFG
jgi:hypothetical protein